MPKTLSHRRRTFWLTFTLFLVLLATGSGATGPIQLKGDFAWERGHQGELTVELRDRPDHTWDIDFRFTFSGKPHLYRGVAQGDLAGDFSGKVKNEDGNRTYAFSGKFVNGTFRGKHAEVDDDGEETPTGTLTLKR